MRAVVEAVIPLPPSPNGFSDTPPRVRHRYAPYGPRHAAYNLKKLRGKHIVCRIGHSRRYQPLASGLRAITALVVLRSGTSGSSMLDTTFLSAMYAAGAGGCFDAIADHPYPANGPKNNTLRGGSHNWERMYLTSPSRPA